MKSQSVSPAPERLSRAIARLSRIRNLVRTRYLGGRTDGRDLTLIMMADVEVERAVVALQEISEGRN